MREITNPVEIRAWKLLDTVPRARNYDRVSIHNAFPHIKQAFDYVILISNLLRYENNEN